ncbi:MAG: helix-turn-helix domain-containing protein [Lewinellaceae bacterium]|nr:helix-turn-helix domain-containing protein [Saprospiraceae bacterium]MCB9338429.1 helix-turn-helix domain-containing protein [Lewinellaceae bacterium]
MKPSKRHGKQKPRTFNHTVQTRPAENPKRDDFLAGIIGQFIERRKELGLSQEEVDGRMGTADRLCSKWECGQRQPTSFNFFCWAQALDARLVLVSGPDKRG